MTECSALAYRDGKKLANLVQSHPHMHSAIPTQCDAELHLVVAGRGLPIATVIFGGHDLFLQLCTCM